MFGLLPLFSGWKYTIKTIEQPTIITNKVLEIYSNEDTSGWFLAGSAITTDPNINLNLYVNGTKVAYTSPTIQYLYGGKQTTGVPFTFLYGQYAPGTNYQLYGIGQANPDGYALNGSVKLTLETQQDELYIAYYDAVFIEITDPIKFLQSYMMLYGKAQYQLPAVEFKQFVSNLAREVKI